MLDSVCQQIYRDAEFMMDACAYSRQTCERQREMLAVLREKLAQSHERQTEWEQKQAVKGERLHESRSVS